MKHAYHFHHYTLCRIRASPTVAEQQLLALNYFLNGDAEIVDEEMKNKLLEDDRNESPTTTD